MSAPGIAILPAITVSVLTNEANNVAAEQIGNIASAAQKMLGNATSAISNIKRHADIPFSALSFSAGSSSITVPSTAPFTANTSNVTIGRFRDSVSIEIPELIGIEPREFTGTPPEIAVSEKPVRDISEKAEFTGEIREVELPVRPALPTDILPQINAILNKYSFPEIALPDVSIPAFSGNATNDLNIERPPDASLDWSELKEDTAVTLALVGSLVRSLSENGFGLDSGVENDIYLRHKSRISAEYDETFSKADARMAAMGWSIPSGSHMAELDSLTEKKNQALLDASRDVMIKNSELTFEDRQKAREVAVQFEGVYRQYIAGYYQRSLEAMKATADHILQVYTVQIEGSKLLLQKYVTDIQLYDAETKSAFLALEVYKGKLEGQKIKAEIRSQDIQAMLGYIQAMEAVVRMYEGELKAAITGIEVDKARVELFDSQVRAWLGEVQAYATDVDAWGKEVQASGLVTQNYLAQAQAYSAEMEGVKAYNGVETSRAQIALSAAQIKLEEFKAKVEAYKAETGASIAGSEAASRIYAAQAQAHSSNAQVQIETVKAQAMVEGIKSDTETKTLTLALEQNKANMENAIRETTIDVEALKAIAQNFSQLSASLYSAINVGASISDTFNRSVSDSSQYQASLSNSLSHIYSEKASE